MNPRVSRSSRAGVEGDRLPDREGRREARRRLHARRDPERPDRHDTRELRADARLRRRQVPALRVREVPGRGHDARHADEVGRRGDGDRAHFRRGVPEGAPLARARRRSTRWDSARGRASVVPGRAGAARGAGRASDDLVRRRLDPPQAPRALGRGDRGRLRSDRGAGAGRSGAPAGVRPAYRRVDSCAAEVEASSNYFYSTWGEADEAPAGRARSRAS